MRHLKFDYLLKLQGELEDNLISSAEFVAKYLLIRPLQFQKKFLFPQLANLSLSKTMGFLNEFHWKGHSDRIRRSLLQWHHQQYPLHLLTHIPTPLELLKLQAQGQRVVTVFLKPEEWATEHHGKNPWDFTVHDLIHADHFFQNPDGWKGQVGFYQFLLRHWNDPPIAELHGQSGFEYLISDMNSHPHHLFLTLQALTLQSIKRQSAKALKTTGRGLINRLSPQEERRFQQIISDWKCELLEQGVFQTGDFKNKPPAASG